MGVCSRRVTEGEETILNLAALLLMLNTPNTCFLREQLYNETKFHVFGEWHWPLGLKGSSDPGTGYASFTFVSDISSNF